MSAAAERRPLTSYALYEGLMRAVSTEDPAQAMDIEGSQALTPQLLLGGQEPTREEEDLWFQERSRCAVLLCLASILLSNPAGAHCTIMGRFAEVEQTRLPWPGSWTWVPGMQQVQLLLLLLACTSLLGPCPAFTNPTTHQGGPSDAAWTLSD